MFANKLLFNQIIYIFVRDHEKINRKFIRIVLLSYIIHFNTALCTFANKWSFINNNNLVC